MQTNIKKIHVSFCYPALKTIILVDLNINKNAIAIVTAFYPLRERKGYFFMPFDKAVLSDLVTN